MSSRGVDETPRAHRWPRYRSGMTTYGLTDLRARAAQLPEAWRSQVLATIGDARLKVVRMDAGAFENECHAYDEALLVLEGTMELELDGAVVPVRGGEIYIVHAGVSHAVAPGSHGTLVIIDL